MRDENLFFEKFVKDFYEGIENTFKETMKKDKAKKLSVGKYEIDAVDYLDASKTPIIETIKDTEEGIKLYFKNREQAPTGYSVEDIFHPFSLAALGDAILGKNKYVKLLENFYIESENIVKKFFEIEEIRKFALSEDEYEVLAVCSEDERFSLVEGICKEIFIKDERVYFAIENIDGEIKESHIIQMNAAEVAMILQNVFDQLEN